MELGWQHGMGNRVSLFFSFFFLLSFLKRSMGAWSYGGGNASALVPILFIFKLYESKGILGTVQHAQRLRGCAQLPLPSSHPHFSSQNKMHKFSIRHVKVVGIRVLGWPIAIGTFLDQNCPGMTWYKSASIYNYTTTPFMAFSATYYWGITLCYGFLTFIVFLYQKTSNLFFGHRRTKTTHLDKKKFIPSENL